MRLGLIKFSSYNLQFAHFQASISNVNKVYTLRMCVACAPL